MKKKDLLIIDNRIITKGCLSEKRNYTTGTVFGLRFTIQTPKKNYILQKKKWYEFWK